ncbi:hypothetical protein DUI87_12095 [Hirundo rustica rustica]|uniref:CCHC-type domain-containing protein n=1 Tax=Hirundo rustica rustica TaxID=333673 RepID=A0A3M0KDD2_HIRRU|nr:hypothetical protein DUI87_12095 [Hirundo rustica rustica]
MANPEQRPIGDVSVPLNTGDVREFKKKMGRLLEDPLGVAERLDQFLCLNIYTWVELQSILGILFTMEERDVIRHSGMRVWDRECQGPDQGDQKWPMQDPGWNNQNERHRQNMSDLQWMIIRGIQEAVPKGQNIGKALSEHQGKDEPLADWLERLRKALQLYSGVDPDTAAGQVLLKTKFVAKSWGHIRKKLEKVENWQDRGLQELLREAQKVCVRRDEERQKTKPQILMAAFKETQTTMNTDKRSGKNKQQEKAGLTSGDTGSTCFPCHQEGHLQTSCPTSRVVFKSSRGGPNVRAVHHPFSQATIRDLCKAHQDYGRDSPYFRGLLRCDLEAAVVIPADLRQLFSCLMDSTEFKLWEAAWRQLLREALPSLLADPETAMDENRNALTLKHLMGEGRWKDPSDQDSGIPIKALTVAREYAVTAFFVMVPDGPVIPYYKIMQGTKETFTKFVERLTQAIEIQVAEVAIREGILSC